MKKIIILAVLVLMLSSSTIISTAIQTNVNDRELEVDSGEQAIKLRVLSIAFPKIARTGRPVFLFVLWPMFLTDGFMHYDWQDGTFQDTGNFAKHIFMEKGTYAITIEFDTIFGLEATGIKRVIII